MKETLSQKKIIIGVKQKASLIMNFLRYDKISDLRLTKIKVNSALHHLVPDIKVFKKDHVQKAQSFSSKTTFPSHYWWTLIKYLPLLFNTLQSLNLCERGMM